MLVQRSRYRAGCWQGSRVEGFKLNLNPKAASPASRHMHRLPCWTAVNPEPGLCSPGGLLEHSSSCHVLSSAQRWLMCH